MSGNRGSPVSYDQEVQDPDLERLHYVLPPRPATIISKLRDESVGKNELFWEEDYAVVCEQPPLDKSRRRIDIVVRRYDREGHAIVTMVFVECKKPKVASDKVETQAENAAKDAVAKDSLKSVFTMATIGTECRMWNYTMIGTEKGLAPMLGKDLYLNADNYDDARKILEAILHIKRNPPQLAREKTKYRQLLPKPEPSQTATGQPYTSSLVGQGPSTYQEAPGFGQHVQQPESRGYRPGVQVARHEYSRAGRLENPSSGYHAPSATGHSGALPLRPRTSEGDRSNQPVTPPRNQGERERSPLAAQPQATPGRRSQSPPQASARASSSAGKPLMRVSVKKVPHELSEHYNFNSRNGPKSTERKDWVRKTIDGKEVFVFEGNKTTYYTERLG
ncbi:hypothetical protein QBC40DRAFT_261219 [Triangularia verruculosa]|uniref:Uncharacterized protein n=1 Tax=Triangularia verruculosa TaxID=2587418 RepID=A0AAN6XQG8_9PEZI|nr:hypothetical protein QBC40DRAFT_261219 [Triangularia verruculosa]